MGKGYENFMAVNIQQQTNSLKTCSLKFNIWESKFTPEHSLSGYLQQSRVRYA